MPRSFGFEAQGADIRVYVVSQKYVCGEPSICAQDCPSTSSEERIMNEFHVLMYERLVDEVIRDCTSPTSTTQSRLFRGGQS